MPSKEVRDPADLLEEIIADLEYQGKIVTHPEYGVVNYPYAEALR